jgi:hypothetical protein
VAAHGLASVDLAFPASPLDPPAWHHTLATVIHERITGLLVKAVTDGALPVDPIQRGEAWLAHREAMATAVRLEQLLVRTSDLFAGAAIEYRVLKGASVAHLDYPDPALRSFGDIDVLVRPEQIDDAARVLANAGHARKFAEPRPGFDRRFGKGPCFVSPAGYEVDLHRTLAMGPYGATIRVDDLWTRSEAIVLADRRILVLGQEERFVHACVHAALGAPVPRLSTLRDIAEMLGRPLDIDRVRTLTERWRAEAVVARALSLAADVLGLAPSDGLLAWAGTYRPTARERRDLALYTDYEQTYAAKAFGALRAVPGLRAKLAYARALALPDRNYFEGRHPGPFRRIARAFAHVRRSSHRIK